MSKTIYERYVNTDNLLACQKSPGELVHPDELFFQTVHQATELWLKVVNHELGEVVRLMAGDEADHWRAVHLLHRVRVLLGYTSEAMHGLESMHPADYMPIRAGLGSGSGMDSPGFRGLLAAAPKLNDAFKVLLDQLGTTPLDLQREPRRRYAVFQLMQGLLDLDEACQKFRYNHVLLAMREIGSVVGLAGTAVPMLMKRAQHHFFPELWEAIAHLSEENRPQY